MKIGIVGDVHFCQYSSIIRGNTDRYSERIENCIKSVNWAEQNFSLYKCDLEVFLGDFFDKSQLVAQEITAINDIDFNLINKVFLVGNHEMWKSDLSTNSAHIFSSSNCQIITQPTSYEYDNMSLLFLPYLIEGERKSFLEYKKLCKSEQIIAFSHNDISGLEMGHYVSKIGFSLDDLKNNCVQFFNGHLHNGQKLCSNVRNVGILTGQNFGEDAFRYRHCIYIYDTDTNKLIELENPYAFNFYKLTSRNQLQDIAYNSILTIKCKSTEYDYWKEAINQYKDKIVTYKFVIQPERQSQAFIDDNIKLLSMDHLSEFKDYVVKKFGYDNYILHELEVLCE